MNREILFRAKRKGVIDGNCYRGKYKNGDWVYGLITKQYSKEFEYKLNDEMRDIYGVSEIEIDRDTVGQFTGLKDKNGRKIFEGDIVKEWSSSWKSPLKTEVGIYEVVCEYLGSLHLIQEMDYGESSTPLFRNSNVEVIGNIYDNPELLGE